MTNNQKEIMTKLQIINEKLKLLKKEQQRLEETYKGLTYDLVNEIEEGDSNEKIYKKNMD